MSPTTPEPFDIHSEALMLAIRQRDEAQQRAEGYWRELVRARAALQDARHLVGEAEAWVRLRGPQELLQRMRTFARQQ